MQTVDNKKALTEFNSATKSEYAMKYLIETHEISTLKFKIENSH